MGKPTGFIEITASMQRHAARRRAAPRLPRGLHPVPRATSSAAGRAVHGLRHPVLPPGLPARQPDPRLERPGLPRPVARRRSTGCTPPTTSPSSPARSARPPARRRACSGSTTTRSRSSRSRRASSTGPWTRAGSSRSRPRSGPARRWRSSARARPAWPRPSSSAAPATPSRSSSAPTGSAACSATASPTSRWRSGVLDRRLAQMEAEGVVFSPASTSASTRPAEALLAEFDAVCLCGGADPAARPADPGPGPRRHPLRDGLPHRSRTAACAGDSVHRRARSSPPTAST